MHVTLSWLTSLSLLSCFVSQVLVQGMMANRYMNTFRDDILGWNKKLMNVADVNQIMSEIQRTWAYLESLFIHSEEVKKELPDATVRFATIDKEVKEVSVCVCARACAQRTVLICAWTCACVLSSMVSLVCPTSCTRTQALRIWLPCIR